MRDDIIKQILKDIDLPYEVKQKAKDRYEDLGKWLNREDSSIVKYHPYVFPQGSFLLQTTIRPITEDGEYDLDIGCKFQDGISDKTITQKRLKEKLKEELEKYRTARNIKEPLEEKRRCWRLRYQDKMNFHIDIVPGIPVLEGDCSNYGFFYVDTYLKGELILNEHNLSLWKSLSLLITDAESNDYEQISENWHHSNPEGFAKWFRAKAAFEVMKGFQLESVRNEVVVDLPISKQDTVLQRVIKLLKRHRDAMFLEDDKYAPISVIISKLAADVYQGESSLEIALMSIISGMQKLLENRITNIPNPTELLENYADKWIENSYYQRNFQMWLIEAKKDFTVLCKDELTREIAEPIIRDSFKIHFADSYAKLVRENSEIKRFSIQPINIAAIKTKPWTK